MTQSRTTLVLALCVLLLGAFIFFFERRVDSTEDRLEHARRALRIDPDSVSTLRIATTNYTLSCAEQTEGWMLLEPVAARGDDGEIGRILQHLAELPRGEIISEEEREAAGLTLRDYGLADPLAEITLTEGELTRTLFFGGQAPVGGAHYLMESNRTDVVATEAPLWDILPREPSDLRSRRLVHLDPREIQRVDVRRPAGFLQLTRDASGAWSIGQPVAARADDAVVGDLLDKICRVEVMRFVTDGVEDLAPYDLAEPDVEISLGTGSGDEPLVVRLGGPLEDDPELIHATASDGASVVAVGRHTLFEAGVEPDLLRDRDLVDLDPQHVAFVRLGQGDRTLEFLKDDAGSWSLTKPRSRQAYDALVWAMIGDWAQATVVAFPADGVTNAAGAGPGQAPLEIVFASEPLSNGPAADPDEAASTPVPELLVRLAVTRGDDGAVQVRINDGDDVYEVAPETLARVRVDPLVYYDRAILSLLPDDVRSITVENGRRQAVARDEQGVFVCEAPGVVVGAVVTNVLEVVSNLRAALFAEENPASLVPYGLEQPAGSLTLGLTGEAGLSKTLLFGGEIENGVFAMIRGQDTVFILPRTLRDRLLSDLCVTAAPDEEEPIDPAPTPAS